MDMFSQHLTTKLLVEERPHPSKVHLSAREANTDRGGHLAVLRHFFPDQSWLTVPQVAACLRLSAGHIYNRHSEGRLPFAMTKTAAGRLRVSVQVLAGYMDSQQALALTRPRPVRGPRLRWTRLPHATAAFQE